MKGQSINIDWTLGFSLFLFTVLSGIIFISGVEFNPNSDSVTSKTEEVQDALEEETRIQGGKIPLYMSTPFNISRVPVDSGFNFPESAYPGSGGMDIPSDVNITGERVVAVTDLENTSHHMVYFEESNDNLSYSSDISVSSNKMENSKISVSTGSPGITSLKVNSKELLNSDADIGESDYETEKDMLHAYSLDGDLRLYDNSRELILENEGNGNATFRIKNLTTLYWGEDNSTTNLAYLNQKSGQTPGFTVASTYGITFTGKMNATVSKPDGNTVKAEIQSERFRIRLHDTGYEAGWKRIKAEEEGFISFGAIQNMEGQDKAQINGLENQNSRAFELKFDLQEWGYNITMEDETGSKLLSRGSKVPLREVSVSKIELPLLNRTGSYSDLESRVILWR